MTTYEPRAIPELPAEPVALPGVEATRAPAPAMPSVAPPGPARRDARARRVRGILSRVGGRADRARHRRLRLTGRRRGLERRGRPVEQAADGSRRLDGGGRPAAAHPQDGEHPEHGEDAASGQPRRARSPRGWPLTANSAWSAATSCSAHRHDRSSCGVEERTHRSAQARVGQQLDRGEPDGASPTRRGSSRWSGSWRSAVTCSRYSHSAGDSDGWVCATRAAAALAYAGGERGGRPLGAEHAVAAPRSPRCTPRCRAPRVRRAGRGSSRR